MNKYKSSNLSDRSTRRHGREQTKGFTLTELIVVLVILAILAALLIPALSGYIERAKKQALVEEARGIYTAAQAAVSEQYVKSNDFIASAKKFRYTNGEVRGCVSNNALSRVQQKKNLNQADFTVDRDIATDVLTYLESIQKPYRYTFNSNVSPSALNAVNSSRINVSEYEKKYGQPSVVIFYQTDGKIDYIQYGKSGYLVTIQGTDVYVQKDGYVAGSASGSRNIYPTFSSDD